MDRKLAGRSNADEDVDIEEGKRDDSYSPRDKVHVKDAEEESKEDSGTNDRPRASNTRPPRPSAFSSLRPANATKEEVVKEIRPQPGPSLPIIHHSNYIRKPDEKLREKLKSNIRHPADGIPEVHFIGEICEGVGFKDTFVSCKW